jgi:hypothetical protein
MGIGDAFAEDTQEASFLNLNRLHRCIAITRSMRLL